MKLGAREAWIAGAAACAAGLVALAAAVSRPSEPVAHGQGARRPAATHERERRSAQLGAGERGEPEAAPGRDAAHGTGRERAAVPREDALPLACVLENEDTGRPAEGCELVRTVEGRPVAFWDVGPGGRVGSPQPVAFGLVLLEVRDRVHGTSLARLDHVHGEACRGPDGCGTFTVSAGRVVLVDLALPAGVGVRDVEWSVVDEEIEHLSRHSGYALIPGEPPSLRLSGRTARSQELQWLHVFTPDGRHTGRAPFPPGAERVSVGLERRATFEGELRSAGGGPVTGARVQLNGPGDVDRYFEARAGSRFRFAGLPGGTYLITARLKRHEDCRRVIEIAAGADREEDVTLEPLPVGGSITGTVTSDTGRFGGVTYLNLRSEHERLQTRVRWRNTRGVHRGTFEFRDVPAGVYRLEVLSSAAFRWTPEVVEDLSPPAEVAITCHDAVETAQLAFDVVDAKTGRPVRDFQVSAWGAEGGREMLLRGSWGAEHPGHPLDRDVVWVGGAPGYLPARGTLADFEADHVGGERVARVRLRRGRGFFVRVLSVEAGGSTARPLDGAEVVVRGVVVGRSSDTEPPFVEGAEPEDVTARLEGWEPHGGSRGPQAVSVVTLWMRRE